MTRSAPRSRRVLVESILAIAAAGFALLAAVWPDWLEAFGIDPDHGNGTVEWAIPVVLAVVAVVLGLLARRHWRIDRARDLPAGA
jgi:hypothetical protein